jgi:hypothetical protein
MLISADIVTSWECDVPSGTRLQLVAELDLYGIGRADGHDPRAEPEITAGARRRTQLDV